MAKREGAKAGANKKTTKWLSGKKPSTRKTSRKRVSRKYEWLASEIAEAKEKKFFVVDGPADRKLCQAIQRTTLSAPRSYKEFALQFGNCKLYRQDDYIDRYHVEVFASMREAVTHDEVNLLWIGAYRSHNSTLVGGAELPVCGVRPGQTRIIEFDCYKSRVPPEDIVAFDYPTPGPEDRERYSEFSALN